MSRYASEVDVDFVRKAVRAVGQAAIKIESAAERCVGVLMELIETRVSYVVQEAVIVIKVFFWPPPVGCLADPCSHSAAVSRTGLTLIRTSSGNILTRTKASSLRYVATSRSWTSQKQKPP